MNNFDTKQFLYSPYHRITTNKKTKMKQFRWQAWQRWWLLYCLVCLQGSAGIYFKIIYPHVFFVHIQPHDNFTQNAENEKSQLLNTFFTNYKKKKIDKLFIKQKRWCGIFSTDMMITMPMRKGSCHDPQWRKLPQVGFELASFWVRRPLLCHSMTNCNLFLLYPSSAKPCLSEKMSALQKWMFLFEEENSDLQLGQS